MLGGLQVVHDRLPLHAHGRMTQGAFQHVLQLVPQNVLQGVLSRVLQGGEFADPIEYLYVFLNGR